VLAVTAAPRQGTRRPHAQTQVCARAKRAVVVEANTNRPNAAWPRTGAETTDTTNIVLLSDAFLHEIAMSFGRPPAGLTRDARAALLEHDWPGNVRELRNALERAAILCEGG